MFDPQEFIQSLFDDTTESTLIFDLTEKFSFMLPGSFSSLIPLLPDHLMHSHIAIEESYILHLILLSASLDQNLFHIAFEAPCILDLYQKERLAGTVHITFKVEATFILRSEHGVGTLTEQSPPKPYECYSPHKLTITSLSFDPDELQFIPRSSKSPWWQFWH